MSAVLTDDAVLLSGITTGTSLPVQSVPIVSTRLRPVPATVGVATDVATSLHPFGMPFTAPLPSGLVDAAVEVRAHGDRFAPYESVAGDADWLAFDGRVLTQTQALAEGAAVAERIGLRGGGRLLCDVTTSADAVLAMLAVPLAVAGSVVLVADPGADLDALAARERCDAVLA